MAGRRHFNPLEHQGPPSQSTVMPRNDYRLDLHTTPESSIYQDMGGNSDQNVYMTADPQSDYGPAGAYGGNCGDNYQDNLVGNSGRNSGSTYGDGNLNENPTYGGHDSDVYSEQTYSEDQSNHSGNSSRPGFLKFGSNDTDNMTQGQRVRKTNGHHVVPRLNQYLSVNINNNHEPQTYFEHREVVQVYPQTPTETNSVENREYFERFSNGSRENFKEPQGDNWVPVAAPRRKTVSEVKPPKINNHFNISRPEPFVDYRDNSDSDDDNVLGGGVGSALTEQEKQNPEKAQDSVRHRRATVSGQPHISTPQDFRWIQGGIRSPLPEDGSSGRINPSSDSAPTQTQPPTNTNTGVTTLLRLQTQTELSEKEWFNKTMDKDEAEEKLFKKKKVGCYVVRNSRHKDWLNFAISFYYLTQSGAGNVKHLSISFMENEHQWKVGTDRTRETPTFYSVVTLVEHYIRYGFSLDDGTSIHLKEILNTKKKSIAGKFFGK